MRPHSGESTSLCTFAALLSERRSQNRWRRSERPLSPDVPSGQFAYEIRNALIRASVHVDSWRRSQLPPSRVAIASIEIRRPRGKAALAGAERAGGGSGMWRA
jgi:hypothetical protein